MNIARAATNAPAKSAAIVVSTSAAICVPSGCVRNARSTTAPIPKPTNVTPAAIALSSIASLALIEVSTAASSVNVAPATTAAMGEASSPGRRVTDPTGSRRPTPW